MILPLVAALIGRRRLTGGRRARLWVAIACVALLEVSLAGNILLLVAGAQIARAAPNSLRAVVNLELGPEAALVPADRSIFFFHVPPRECLEALMMRFGDPRSDILLSGTRSDASARD